MPFQVLLYDHSRSRPPFIYLTEIIVLLLRPNNKHFTNIYSHSSKKSFFVHFVRQADILKEHEVSILDGTQSNHTTVEGRIRQLKYFCTA